MKILTVLLVAAIWPAVAFSCEKEEVTYVSADNTSDATADQASSDNTTAEDAANNPRHRALMGKLIDVKDVEIQDNEAKHVLAKIETPSGHIVIADLGERGELKDAKLMIGERIEVYGIVGRLNDRPLLVAEQIGEVINIKRTSNKHEHSAEDASKTNNMKTDAPAGTTADPMKDSDMKK